MARVRHDNRGDNRHKAPMRPGLLLLRVTGKSWHELDKTGQTKYKIVLKYAMA
jgi:hypothetical protein